MRNTIHSVDHLKSLHLSEDQYRNFDGSRPEIIYLDDGIMDLMCTHFYQLIRHPHALLERCCQCYQ